MEVRQVEEVLRVWAEYFVEDVPAIHQDGKYLIEYNTLVEHLKNIDYVQATEILIKVEESLLAS